jgi:hypothetical protein
MISLLGTGPIRIAPVAQEVDRGGAAPFRQHLSYMGGAAAEARRFWRRFAAAGDLAAGAKSRRGTRGDCLLGSMEPRCSSGPRLAAGRVKMLGGMTVRRVVATADVTAGPAQPQVHPHRARLQAFLAPARVRRNFPDGFFVQTCVGHHALPSCRTSAGRLPASARKACSVATTCAPSPTAAATRLIDPDRTSPMANTPRSSCPAAGLHHPPPRRSARSP